MIIILLTKMNVYKEVDLQFFGHRGGSVDIPWQKQTSGFMIDGILHLCAPFYTWAAAVL